MIVPSSSEADTALNRMSIQVVDTSREARSTRDSILSMYERLSYYERILEPREGSFENTQETMVDQSRVSRIIEGCIEDGLNGRGSRRVGSPRRWGYISTMNLLVSSGSIESCISSSLHPPRTGQTSGASLQEFSFSQPDLRHETAHLEQSTDMRISSAFLDRVTKILSQVLEEIKDIGGYDFFFIHRQLATLLFWLLKQSWSARPDLVRLLSAFHSLEVEKPDPYSSKPVKDLCLLGFIRLLKLVATELSVGSLGGSSRITYLTALEEKLSARYPSFTPASTSDKEVQKLKGSFVSIIGYENTSLQPNAGYPFLSYGTRQVSDKVSPSLSSYGTMLICILLGIRSHRKERRMVACEASSPCRD